MGEEIIRIINPVAGEGQAAAHGVRVGCGSFQPLQNRAGAARTKGIMRIIAEIRWKE